MENYVMYYVILAIFISQLLTILKQQRIIQKALRTLGCMKKALDLKSNIIHELIDENKKLQLRPEGGVSNIEPGEEVCK